jgi:hypothetical protein
MTREGTLSEMPNLRDLVQWLAPFDAAFPIARKLYSENVHIR